MSRKNFQHHNHVIENVQYEIHPQENQIFYDSHTSRQSSLYQLITVDSSGAWLEIAVHDNGVDTSSPELYVATGYTYSYDPSGDASSGDVSVSEAAMYSYNGYINSDYAYGSAAQLYSGSLYATQDDGDGYTGTWQAATGGYVGAEYAQIQRQDKNTIGGQVYISAGSANQIPYTNGTATGGDVSIYSGYGQSVHGQIEMGSQNKITLASPAIRVVGLPTSDPHQSGNFWIDPSTRVLKVSNG